MADEGLEFDTSPSETLKQLVARYCATQRHPDLKPFIVHGLHTLESWWKTNFAARAGCYAIYGQDGRILYIGKASLNASIGSRLAAHLRHVRPTWETPKFVHLIEVAEPFEAPSLEEYLLRELSTRHNTQGGRKVAPPQPIEVSVFNEALS